uniref:Odorant binding protein n=1 Tax=Meteorus pulchricornis TaxID=51522 RepID=A0A1S5VFI5_9HYME
MYRSTITILVLCALSIGVLTHHHGPPPEVKAAMDKCVKEAGGDESTMPNLRRHEELADPKFKCVAACVMKELGQMSADGTVDKNSAFAKMPEDIPDRDKLIAEMGPCFDEKGADECETANLIRKCMMEKMPRGPPPH